MILYNAELRSAKSKTDVLRHFALTPTSAANRVEGMFTSQQRCAISPDSNVYVLDDSDRKIGTKTLSEYLFQFCAHASQCTISTYEVEIKKPLRLNDLWDDDPIGSAGLEIVSRSSVSPKEFEELEVIFGPFKNAMDFKFFPRYYSLNDIKGLKRSYKTNRIFQNEYTKRKIRAKATNDLFSPELELIWLDLTIKLRTWALGRGYDSFVYTNIKEGAGEDSYICLMQKQAKTCNDSLHFLDDKYIQEAPEKVLKHVKNNLALATQREIIHGLWGGEDPLRYWDTLGRKST